MPQTPQLSVTPSTTTSTSGSVKRRSIRIPRRSEEVVSSSDIRNVMGAKDSEKNVVQSNSLDSPPLQEGWRHPAELQYIRRADWSKDLMITYLCQKAFTVPPRQLNTTLSYTEITRSFSGEKIHIPRGYRIPLMFVAKFQWESLRLVLNNASEWEEYKFDIIHLSRLCTHFFKQAKSAASEKKLTKGWRSPMFDRALIRFYRKWMVSREWSVKKFWEEYEEEEYKIDVLKFDWSRWVLKGHKGFFLTKDEVHNGVTADQYTDGLKRRPDGTWIWGGDDSGARATSLDALTCLASQDAVEAITDATSSHDSIEVKRERLELDSDEVVLNTNGKRLRDDDGDSPPRKLPTRKKMPNVDDKDKAAVVLRKGGVEGHVDSPQETPTNGVDIALEVGAVESRSLGSQSFKEAPTVPVSDSKAANHSVTSHGEFQAGDSRKIETMHVNNSKDKMNLVENMVRPIRPMTPLSDCFWGSDWDSSSDSDWGFGDRLESTSYKTLSQGVLTSLPSQRLESVEVQIGAKSEVPAPHSTSTETLSQGVLTSLPSQRFESVEVEIGAKSEVHAPQSTSTETLSQDVLTSLPSQQFESVEVQIGAESEVPAPQSMSTETLSQGVQTSSPSHVHRQFESVEVQTEAESEVPAPPSTSIETLSQGVQTSLPPHVNLQFESVEVQTEAESEVPVYQQPLSADVSMVDLTLHTPPFPERPSTPAANAEYQPENNRSVAKTVLSIMRNMADLLECTSQGGSVKSLKGKEKEVTDVDMTPSCLDSPAFTTILEEFKSMKEEMRRSQHRSQSEVESIKLAHFMEVEALKDEIRAIESKGKQELEEVTRQYSQQIGELKSTIWLKAEREGGRDREKETGSEKLPSVELLDIRRRVASLEARSRSHSIPVDMLPSGSRASMTNGYFQEPVISRDPPPHFLPTDFEEKPYSTKFRAPGQFMREGSTSKPGTPAPTDRNTSSNRHPDVMDLDESIPLPAKSQRKMQMMNFLRPPIG